MKNCKRSRRQVAGFTLIELMIVVVIAAVLLAIAIPSFSTMIKKNNVEALQAKLSGAVSTARSEAASRNVFVSICLTADFETCAAAGDDDWSAGWIVFTDRGVQGQVDGDDEIIDVFENMRLDYTIMLSEDVAALTYSSQGFLVGGNDVLITVCRPENNEAEDIKFARGLIVTSSGLLVKTNDTDADGVHDRPAPGGAPPVALTCN